MKCAWHGKVWPELVTFYLPEPFLFSAFLDDYKLRFMRKFKIVWLISFFFSYVVWDGRREEGRNRERGVLISVILNMLLFRTCEIVVSIFYGI